MSSLNGSRVDLSRLRARLSEQRGPLYWRALEELADTPEFQELVAREFPRQASEWLDPMSRRRFIKLMGASLALAGLTACAHRPPETIVPYVRPPEEIVPGKPLFFATAMTLGGTATGLLVESHMGRPTKIEGNTQHPASLGATDAFAQASILSLYDPDRSQTINYLGEISSWAAFLGAMRTELDAQRQKQGAGLRILSETVISPTLAEQMRALLTSLPAAKWYQYEPVNRDNVRAGAQLAFGEDVNTIYRPEGADVVLSLGSDFLSCGPGNLRYARAFAARRRVTAGKMNRLYAIESTPTNAGALADHRLPVRPSRMEAYARAVAAALGVGTAAPVDQAHTRWIEALARDLNTRRGSSLVIAGDEQPPIVHALAYAINNALGNFGQTVLFTDAVEPAPAAHFSSLAELAREMEAGAVELLVILGGNPVYTAPADLAFAERLKKVKLRAHLSLYEDETSELCQWHVPEAHYLEAWSDTRAFDGSVTITQPLIAPLYQGRSAHEVIAAFTGEPDRAGYDIVRDYWRGQIGEADFERKWRRLLHDGVVPDTALPLRTVTLKTDWINLPQGSTQPDGAAGLELIFRADPAVYDGRFSNNGWLQELPRPLTKLTWDNAALISVRTAQRLGLRSEDVVEIKSQGRTLRAPVWVMPGQADDTVTLHLGYGRTRAGRVGTGTGVNAYALRITQAPWSVTGAQIVKTDARYALATTQLHHLMEGRNLVQASTLADYRNNPRHESEGGHHTGPARSLYPEYNYTGYKWGMAIDLNACMGCSACVVACQAENNIPVVGKTEVINQREMHWLRIDRYYGGNNLDNPDTYFQPMLCMHCEKAPCEVVCPVAATAHSSEGLNDMVYNRCVGTRYCSNNCPYKVRRFNFLQYSDFATPSLQLMRNPDVTVRSRGVMEKCTYCVQRINYARIEAEKEDRRIGDGEIVTACQAACPTDAIVFGDLNDAGSRVAKLKADERNYELLGDLNTQPRTTYLAAVRNPNPEIKD